jgi:hypothetical protein
MDEIMPKLLLAAILIAILVTGSAAIADDIDREFAQSGRLRDLETQREASRMQREGEWRAEWRALQRSCRCRLNH